MEDPKKSEPPPDLGLIVQAMKKCRRDDGALSTNHYLCACNEVIRMFRQLGRGHGFILHDVDSAVKCLEIRRVTGSKDNYDCLDYILQHEAEQGIANTKGDVQSGTRGIVRLYRAMVFILEFLERLRQAFLWNKQLTSREKINVYQRTLAPHHPFFVQGLAKIALMQIPDRHELMEKISAGAHGVFNPIQMLTVLLESAMPVQLRVGTMLQEYGLLTPQESFKLMTSTATSEESTASQSLSDEPVAGLV